MLFYSNQFATKGNKHNSYPLATRLMESSKKSWRAVKVSNEGRHRGRTRVSESECINGGGGGRGDILSPYDPLHTWPRFGPYLGDWLIFANTQGGTINIRGFTTSTHLLSVNLKSRPVDIWFPPFINRMPIWLPSSIFSYLSIAIGSFVKNHQVSPFIEPLICL